MNAQILFLLLVLLFFVCGIALIRRARQHNLRVWGEKVCPGGGCRFRNRPDAKFCGRCGRPLDGA